MASMIMRKRIRLSVLPNEDRHLAVRRTIKFVSGSRQLAHLKNKHRYKITQRKILRASARLAISLNQLSKMENRARGFEPLTPWAPIRFWHALKLIRI